MCVCVCVCVCVERERDRKREREKFYSAIKSKNLPLAATGMDLECIMLSEVSQTEEDIYCMTSYMWNLKNTKI